MNEPAPVDRDGNELHIGDQVRRGRGTTTWRITSIDDFIGLESTTTAWTHSSVTRDKAHTLAHLDTTPWLALSRVPPATMAPIPTTHAARDATTAPPPISPCSGPAKRTTPPA